MIERGLRHWNIRFGLGLPPSTGMREALQWLMLSRLGISYAVLAMVVLQQVFHHGTLIALPLIFGYALLVLSFAFNFFSAQFLEKLPQQWWVAGVHILFDALVTSSWILFSGGRQNLFVLVYLLQILSVSLILYQKGSLLASAASIAGYGIVTVLNPQANPLLDWAVYSALFLTLGVVGGYLSEELLRTNESLKEKSRKIEALMALHEQIIANMPTGLLTVDNDLRINFINPAGEHILGRTSAAIVGRTLLEAESGLLPFFHEVRGISEERLPQRVEIGKGAGRRILRGDVADLDSVGVGSLLDERAKSGRVLLFQDVTKVLGLEEKLKQNEKLAAVGQLAAGIAHEIRNPLASMSASIEMLKGSMPPDPSYQENQKLMEIAIREIDRLNRLVSEFLNFVKPEKFRFETVELDKLLSELVVSVRRSKDFKDKIQLQENYDPKAQALANGEKLKQVAWNLLVNAVQAMNKPGQIEVGCAVAEPGRVKFWVQDEGQGMNEEVLAHLYEPFFTTKDKGTGLGLATAYKIIEAHHGEIRVTSTVGSGTRFEIHLQTA